jgi:hypothetical protein
MKQLMTGSSWYILAAPIQAFACKSLHAEDAGIGWHCMQNDSGASQGLLVCIAIQTAILDSTPHVIAACMVRDLRAATLCVGQDGGWLSLHPNQYQDAADMYLDRVICAANVPQRRSNEYLAFSQSEKDPFFFSCVSS